MISGIVFVVVVLAPIAIYLLNAGLSMRESRGIAAGIPKPKEAKVPRGGRTKKPRSARVGNPRVKYCGRGFTHVALALVGSQDACRYCDYLEQAPAEPTPIRPEKTPEPVEPGRDSDAEAALRAAEEILERNSHT